MTFAGGTPAFPGPSWLLLPAVPREIVSAPALNGPAPGIENSNS
jgi:hypothetical protein